VAFDFDLATKTELKFTFKKMFRISIFNIFREKMKKVEFNLIKTEQYHQTFKLLFLSNKLECLSRTQNYLDRVEHTFGDSANIVEGMDDQQLFNKLQSPWRPNLRGRLSTVDLLIKAPCFTKRVNNIFNLKRAYSN
jgi:hypothetical protein